MRYVGKLTTMAACAILAFSLTACGSSDSDTPLDKIKDVIGGGDSGGGKDDTNGNNDSSGGNANNGGSDNGNANGDDANKGKDGANSGGASGDSPDNTGKDFDNIREFLVDKIKQEKTFTAYFDMKVGGKEHKKGEKVDLSVIPEGHLEKVNDELGVYALSGFYSSRFQSTDGKYMDFYGYMPSRSDIKSMNDKGGMLLYEGALYTIDSNNNLQYGVVNYKFNVGLNLGSGEIKGINKLAKFDNGKDIVNIKEIKMEKTIGDLKRDGGKGKDILKINGNLSIKLQDGKMLEGDAYRYSMVVFGPRAEELNGEIYNRVDGTKKRAYMMLLDRKK